MSLVTDSPVHSSSSDDFAAFLDTELDSKSSASSASDDEAPNQRHSDSAASSSPDQDKEAEEDDDSDFQRKRVKRSKVETVEIVEDDGGTTSFASLKHNSEASISKEICTHPGSFGTMCIVCGQLLDGESGVTFGYIHKGLRLGNDEIVRLRNTDMKNLLRHKKLYLILDLDHTLLNSTQLMHMTLDEEYLNGQTDSLQGFFCYLIIEFFPLVA
uniref:protein-serine/threonine phosphatase n=1 Tax=Populus trichocarpa TaxID=3694 RepID=A0A2K1WZ64_POPTR|eukprot:XP_024445776.1 RNA polymerase II C-terminal domain phosphatase-like 4 [Populus trichocarpa]